MSVKNSAGKPAVTPRRQGLQINRLAPQRTQEKVRLDEQASGVSSPKQRKEKAGEIIEGLESPKASTARPARNRPTTSQAKPTKLARWTSEKSVGRLEKNKKEKPAETAKQEKPPIVLFNQKKKEKQTRTTQSDVNARKVQAAKANLPPPPTGAANCCLDIVRIFREDQLQPLREPLKEHFGSAGLAVEIGFLEKMSTYSNDRLPSKEEAQSLIDTYGAPGSDKWLNVENKDPWGTAQRALGNNDLQAFLDIVMGGVNERADDDANAVLPQIALGLGQKYGPFVKAHTPSNANA